jgi:hypothetical protein
VFRFSCRQTITFWSSHEQRYAWRLHGFVCPALLRMNTTFPVSKARILYCLFNSTLGGWLVKNTYVGKDVKWSGRGLTSGTFLPFAYMMLEKSGRLSSRDSWCPWRNWYLTFPEYTWQELLLEPSLPMREKCGPHSHSSEESVLSSGIRRREVRSNYRTFRSNVCRQE